MSSHPHCGQCSHWSRFLGTGLGRCQQHDRTSSCVHRCSDFVDCLTPSLGQTEHQSDVVRPALSMVSSLAIIRVERSHHAQPVSV